MKRIKSGKTVGPVDPLCSGTMVMRGAVVTVDEGMSHTMKI